MAEKEDKLALIVENANTKLIEIINEAVMLGYNKTYSKARVINLIDETAKELEDNNASDVLIQSTKIALQKAFMKEWLQVIVILREKVKNDAVISVYLVGEGETLFDCAKALGSDEEELLALNPELDLPLKVGDKVLLYRPL